MVQRTFEFVVRGGYDPFKCFVIVPK